MDRKRIDLIIAKTRKKMQDIPVKNKLIDGEAFSKTQIEFAIEEALDKLGDFPPLINLSSESYSDSMIIKGVICSLMETAGLLDTRNVLEYQDNGITIKDTHEKQNEMFAQKYAAIFEKEATRFKISKNISMSNRMMPRA